MNNKTNYKLPVHGLTVTGCEAGRTRQLIELIDNDEYAVIEFLDELHKVKPFDMLDRVEKNWVVGERKCLNFYCNDEAWTIYVKEFALYLRNCGTSKMCHEFLSKMESLGKVSSIKISKFRKVVKKEEPKEEKVPALTGPERIMQAYKERHANESVIDLPNTFIPKEEDDIIDTPTINLDEMMPKEDDTPPFFQEQEPTITVARRDLLSVIEYACQKDKPRPSDAIANITLAILNIC